MAVHGFDLSTVGDSTLHHWRDIITSGDTSESCSRESLVRITIPSSVTSIGHGAMKFWYVLKEVNFSQSGLQNIRDSAFMVVHHGRVSQHHGNKAFAKCISLKQVNLCDCLHLHNIGESAFHSCRSLERISMPSCVTSITDSMFNNCRDLKEVMFGEGLQYIEVSAFRYCKSLERIAIPYTVTNRQWCVRTLYGTEVVELRRVPTPAEYRKTSIS